MDITKVTKCICKSSIWSLKCGDITAFKIKDGKYWFLAVDSFDNTVFWDSWPDDFNHETFSKTTKESHKELKKLLIEII